MEYVINPIGLEKAKRLLEPKIVDKAVVRTINDVAKIGRTAAIKEITSVYNLPTKRIKEDIPPITRWQRATKNNHIATIIVHGEFRGQWPSWKEFKAKKLKRGVSVKILKKKGTKKYPHAFQATMPSGHTGFFVRYGPKLPSTRQGDRYTGTTVLRQRIREKTGPGIPYMFRKVALAPLNKTVIAKLPSKFKSNYAFFLSKANK